MSNWDCKQLVEESTEQVSKKAKQNCKYLLELDNLPHMEPRLHQIHFETYLMTLYGFPNISLILQGVLLEALLKEIIFEKERKDFFGAYGNALRHCKEKQYLEQSEYDFFNNFREKIRNRYQHIDVNEITKGSYADVYKISVEEEDKAKAIFEGVKDVIEGKPKPPEKKTSQDIRPLGHIIKLQIDEEIYIEQFLYVDYFTRKLCRKYFPIT